jgi:hypothetical protein
MPDGMEFMDRITGGRGVSPAPMPDQQMMLQALMARLRGGM